MIFLPRLKQKPFFRLKLKKKKKKKKKRSLNFSTKKEQDFKIIMGKKGPISKIVTLLWKSTREAEIQLATQSLKKKKSRLHCMLAFVVQGHRLVYPGGHCGIEPSKSPFGAPVFFVWRNQTAAWDWCATGVNWTESCHIWTKIPYKEASSSLSWIYTPDIIRFVFESRQIFQKWLPTLPFGLDIFSTRWRDSDFAMPQPRLCLKWTMSSYLRKFVVVFLDNILIFSRSWEEHLMH